MPIPRSTSRGTAVRWIGEPYTELLEDVAPGTVGVFVDFDGPGSAEAIVSFPGIGTFVCSGDDIELADQPTP